MRKKQVSSVIQEDKQAIPSSALFLEEVALDQLHPHPRNYRVHPDDEIDHLMESIRSNGIYRNIVIAQDGTILAGHGVVTAARKLGLTSVPVYRTAYDPDDLRAMKLLVSDNEIAHLASADDRVLTELLRELKDSEIDLLGTGYDDMMLANLVMVTRPASEIADLDAAAQWAGMPEYDAEGEHRSQIIVNFAIDDDRRSFCSLLNIAGEELRASSDGPRLWSRSIWWPPREKNDPSSLQFAHQESNQ